MNLLENHIQDTALIGIVLHVSQHVQIKFVVWWITRRVLPLDLTQCCPCTNAILRRCTAPYLVQVLAWHRTGAKPLPEPVVTYGLLDSIGTQISENAIILFKFFLYIRLQYMRKKTASEMVPPPSTFSAKTWGSIILVSGDKSANQLLSRALKCFYPPRKRNFNEKHSTTMNQVLRKLRGTIVRIILPPQVSFYRREFYLTAASFIFTTASFILLPPVLFSLPRVLFYCPEI